MDDYDNDSEGPYIKLPIAVECAESSILKNLNLPERSLWASVLRVSLWDCLIRKDEALEWLHANDNETKTGSFLWILSILGLADRADEIRSHVINGKRGKLKCLFFKQ